MTELSELVHIGQEAGHTVVETAEFVACARGLLGEQERTALITHLAMHPTAGALMEGTGGARKLRWGALGKGKRGGCRVITYYAGPEVPVFLLTVYGKGERANISKAERNELRAVLAETARRYRERR